MGMDINVIGLVEKIKVNNKVIEARIDTGAKYSSISKELVNELPLQPLNKTIIIRSSNGKEKRKMVKGTIILSNKQVDAQFTVTDRSKMRYKILIGQDVLTQGFIIDPRK